MHTAAVESDLTASQPATDRVVTLNDKQGLFWFGWAVEHPNPETPQK